MIALTYRVITCPSILCSVRINFIVLEVNIFFVHGITESDFCCSANLHENVTALVARQAAVLQILTYVTAHHAFANHIHYVDDRGRC